MNKIDKLCVWITNGIFKGIYYITIPFNYLLCFIPKVFQRQYSFCFLFNFILLSFPSVIILTVFIDYHKEIKSLKILPYYILTLIMLAIDLNMIFFIYTIYQEHSIHNNRRNKYSLFSHKLFKYINQHKRVFILFLLFLANIIIGSLAVRIIKEKEYLIDEFPIIKDTLLLSDIIILLFGCSNLMIYSILIMAFFCASNYSCFCDLCFNDNRYDKVFQFDKLPFYLQCIFKFYLFFGLFDYRKMESNEEVASYQSNANLNSSNINTNEHEQKTV